MASPSGSSPGPEGEQVERHEDDRDLRSDRVRRRLAPEPCLQALERQHEAVLPGEDLAIDDPGPAERTGGLDDLGELRAHVVEVARVEAHVRPALVELGPDAVVLVLDPDLRAEPSQDLGRVLRRGGEHELERMEERELGVIELVVAGQLGEPADVAGQHARPFHGIERTVEGFGDRRLDEALAKADPELPAEHLDDALGRGGIASGEELREQSRLGGRTGGGLDRCERGRHLGERR